MNYVWWNTFQHTCCFFSPWVSNICESLTRCWELSQLQLMSHKYIAACQMVMYLLLKLNSGDDHPIEVDPSWRDDCVANIHIIDAFRNLALKFEIYFEMWNLKYQEFIIKEERRVSNSHNTLYKHTAWNLRSKPSGSLVLY